MGITVFSSIDGVIVCKEFEKTLKDAWKAEEKEAKRRAEEVWKRLSIIALQRGGGAEAGVGRLMKPAISWVDNWTLGLTSARLLNITILLT